MQNNTDRKYVGQSTDEATWQIIDRDFAGAPAELPKGRLLLPLAYWLAHKASIIDANPTAGVWIDSDQEVENLADHIPLLETIGVNFPVFTDGRGFSTGRILRERYQFNGQLIAIGNAIQDQRFYLKRCGFDAFQHPQAGLQSLQSVPGFSVTYQSSVEQPVPLFRRR